MSSCILFLMLMATVQRLHAVAPKIPADLQLSLNVQLARPSDPRCHNRTLSCADCSHVNVCAYLAAGYTYQYTRQCPDSAPFCTNGECVKQSEAGCQLPPKSQEFTCYPEAQFQGYYPAARDCSKYYVCSGTQAYVYNCPEDHIYSHVRAMCVRKDLYPDACYMFPYCGSNEFYALYKPDPTVYAFCYYGNVLVTKCSPNYRMDPTRPDLPCKPYCARQGRIADEDDARAYYDCNLVPLSGATTNCTRCAVPGTLSDPIKQFCPPDMVYNAGTQRCVPLTAAESTTEIAYGTGISVIEP